MTTTINDISDLARILEERPEWAETLRSLLLSREVLEQPEKMAQLTERVDALTERMDQFILEIREFTRETREHNRQADARLDRFDQFILEMREHNRRADARMDRFDQFIQETREHIREMREHSRQVEERLDQFILEMREFVQETKENNRRVDARMDRFEDRLGHLMGSELENQLHGRIVPLIAGRLNLRRPVILKSRFFQLEPALYDQLDAAEDDGRITPRQSGQLQQADFILRGQRKDTREPVYVVVEASRTIKENDITRARERADILASVTGSAALAVATGHLVAEPQESQATDWAVTLIPVAEPESEE